MYGVGRMLLTGMVGDDVNALIKTGMLPNSVKYRLRKKSIVLRPTGRFQKY